MLLSRRCVCPRLNSGNWSPADASRWDASRSTGSRLGTFLWISQPDTCAEKALSLGEGQQEGEDASWNPSWLRHAHPHQDQMWRWWARKRPLGKQPKPPLLGVMHSKFICTLFHMYFFFSPQVLCFLYTYFVFSTHTLLLTDAFIFFTTLVSLLNSFFKEDKNWGPSSSFSLLELLFSFNILWSLFLFTTFTAALFCLMAT